MFPDKSSGQTHCLEPAWAALRRMEKTCSSGLGSQVTGTACKRAVTWRHESGIRPGWNVCRFLSLTHLVGPSCMKWWDWKQLTVAALPWLQDIHHTRGDPRGKWGWPPHPGGIAYHIEAMPGNHCSEWKQQGDKELATKPKPGTYTLSWSFSHELLVPATKPSSPLPWVPVIGVSQSSNRLGPHCNINRANSHYEVVICYCVFIIMEIL